MTLLLVGELGFGAGFSFLWILFGFCVACGWRASFVFGSLLLVNGCCFASLLGSFFGEAGPLGGVCF